MKNGFTAENAEAAEKIGTRGGRDRFFASPGVRFAFSAVKDVNRRTL
jgi:hypothetical protein